MENQLTFIIQGFLFGFGIIPVYIAAWVFGSPPGWKAIRKKKDWDKKLKVIAAITAIVSICSLSSGLWLLMIVTYQNYIGAGVIGTVIGVFVGLVVLAAIGTFMKLPRCLQCDKITIFRQPDPKCWCCHGTGRHWRTPLLRGHEYYQDDPAALERMTEEYSKRGWWEECRYCKKRDFCRRCDSVVETY